MLFTCSSSRHPTSPSHFRSVACAHNLVSISSHHQKGLCKEFLSSFFWCNKQFSLLTDACISEKKEAKVISELRAACKSTAVGLWKVIRTNEALDYLGTRGMQTSKIYRAIVDYFGELPYSERNFRDARDKKQLPKTSEKNFR